MDLDPDLGLDRVVGAEPGVEAVGVGECVDAGGIDGDGRHDGQHLPVPASRATGPFPPGAMLYARGMFWKLPALGKISRIGIVPPAPEPGRGGVAVALIVRDEARHIGEWAAFHLARRGAALPDLRQRRARRDDADPARGAAAKRRGPCCPGGRC